MKLKSISASCSAFLALALSCSAAAPVFLKAASLSTSGTTPAGLAVADIDGDGHPDIVYADNAAEKVTVLINDGTGQHYTSSDVVLSSSNELSDAVAVGNLFTSVTGTAVNSHPDIVLASSANLHLLQNKGNGAAGVASFQEQGTALSDPNAYLKRIKVADLNGDGYDDIIAVGEVYGGSPAAVMEVFINKGAAGGFNDPVESST